jgi:hypothetical protein
MKSKILRVVTSYYLDSGDFNGTSAIQLMDEIGTDWSEMNLPLKELIEDDLIGVQYCDLELNSHILRLGFPSQDVQIAKLITDDIFHTCIYPRPNHLQKVVNESQYLGEPYKLCLALGEPQFAYRAFDLNVLEFYRNDPRYFYSNDDINGFISVRSNYCESDKMYESDQVLLETFGFAYDDDLNRAVVSYIGYLKDLSPAHQQIWKAKELNGNYQLHPDYFRNTIIGDFGEKVSIFSAFVNELYIVNCMAKAMERPKFFKKDYGEYGEGTPQKFSFLVRPTLEEFNSFVLLLDKLLSENINKEFFQNEVLYESESERNDGKILIQQKGTLQILDDWVRKYFRMNDWKPWEESIKAMKDVRKFRQKPAHTIDENLFGQRYFKDQRELMIRAYGGVRSLRLLFANHPDVKRANIKIPEWLSKGEIWTY